MAKRTHGWVSPTTNSGRPGGPDEWGEPTVEESSEFASEAEREAAWRTNRDYVIEVTHGPPWALERHG